MYDSAAGLGMGEEPMMLTMLPFRRANGRRGEGTPFPLLTGGEAEAEYRRAEGEFRPSPPTPHVPLVPRAMGGGQRGGRGLRTEADREEVEGDGGMRVGLVTEEERAARVVAEEGWGGVRERLRGLRERMVVEEGRLREAAEEAVREELAREGRSWGDS